MKKISSWVPTISIVFQLFISVISHDAPINFSTLVSKFRSVPVNVHPNVIETF